MTIGYFFHLGFEVAMHRDKYPEKVPFRLTRMLINAMEVSGIEGNFRSTCENVMQVLRENKESLMAVLEAFVYDPLINWRLLTPNGPDGPKEGEAKLQDENESSDERSGGSDEDNEQGEQNPDQEVKVKRRKKKKKTSTDDCFAAQEKGQGYRGCGCKR